MTIEIILILLLAVIFYIYLRRWPTSQEETTEKDLKEAEKERARKTIKEAKAPISDNEEVVELVKKANEHYVKEEWKKAEKLYLKAASLDPACGKAYSRLGVIYLKMNNNHQDALEAFKQALKLDPNNGYILNNMGLVYHSMEKYDKSIECLEKAIKIDISQASRHANLGIVYFAKRQYAKAERAFKKAVALDPDNHEYHDLLKEAADKKISHNQLIKR